VPPGTGYDGILELYGKAVGRNLTAEQKTAVSEFRQWMEGTFDATSGYNKGTWAREAGARTASFSAAGAEARANLYAEFQRQIILATGGAGSSWKAFAERGADGSYIFRGAANPPGGGEQRVFVVKSDGSCHVGTRSALVGSGQAKSPDYTKLTPVTAKAPSGGSGGGGGGGTPKTVVTEPVKAPTVEVGGGGVEPATPEAPVPEGTPRVPEIPVGGSGGLIKGGLKLGGNIAVLVIMWWLGKKSAEAAQAHLQELVDTKLEPAIVKALIDKAAAIDALTAKDPSHPLYVNITADYDSTWTDSGIAHNEDTHEFTDVRLVDTVFSSAKLGWTSVIAKDDMTPLFSEVTTVWETKRVMFSILLFDPEFEAWKAERGRAYEEYAAKNPWIRITPPSGDAAKEFQKTRWVRAIMEITEWRRDEQVREWQRVIDASRKQRQQGRARIEVIR